MNCRARRGTEIKIQYRNCVKFGAVNLFSRHGSLEKITTREQSITIQDVIHLVKRETGFSIRNHFNSHVCKVYAFTYKKELMNLSESFMLLSTEKKKNKC